MTRLPVDSWDVKARPDLPAYDMPGEGEDHHLWRRSFGKHFGQSFWVELPDGQIVPNRYRLSPEKHRLITENKARIMYDAGTFYWVDPSGTVPLDPQPGPPVPESDTHGYHEVAPGLPLAPAISPESRGGRKPPEPGQECPACKRRVPHPKKKTSPQTKTFSYRVPMDDVETHTEILEAAARHLGVYEQPHWRYWLATKSAVLALQAQKEDL